MGFDIDTTGGVQEGNDSAFAPLVAGKYQATVFDMKNGTYSATSNNPKRSLVNVQFRIANGQTGANRRIFERVGLFLNFNPKPGDDKGADNFRFYQFFAAVLGISEKDFRAKVKEVGAENLGSILPEFDEVLGKQVTLDLGIENDTYAFNKAKQSDPTATQEAFKRNNVRNITVAGEIVATGGSDTSNLDTETSVVL